MIKIWQSLGFIISILDRIYRYAGLTGSFFTLDGSKRIRLKKHGFYATTIKWDSHHRTCHLLLSVRFSKKNFKKRDSHLFPPRYFEGKKELWQKKSTFPSHFQIAGLWNTTLTAHSRKDEPTTPCYARKKVTCCKQCITKWNRRVESFFCWMLK